MARRSAYQLIGAASVIENVRSCAQLPSCESVARPLTKLPVVEQKAAWQEAVETAPDGKIAGQSGLDNARPRRSCFRMVY